LESVFHADLTKLGQQQNFADIILIAGSVGFSAHRYFNKKMKRIDVEM
jgi:hypothetical protein